MKQRFNYLDIRTTINELSPLLNSTYIQNIYSSGQRTFYLRTNKNVLLIEAGMRIHLTEKYETDSINFFCKRMRMCLRRKRVCGIGQVGFDRAVVILLDDLFVVVEMFSGGNIIVLELEDENEVNAESKDSHDKMVESKAENNDEVKDDGKSNKKLSQSTSESSAKSKNKAVKNGRTSEENKLNKKMQKKLLSILGEPKTTKRKKIVMEDIYDIKKKFKILEIFRPVEELKMVKGAYYRFNPIDLQFKHNLYGGMDTFLGLDGEINKCVENYLQSMIYKHRGTDTAKDGHKKVDLNALSEEEIFFFEKFFATLKEKFKENKNYGAIVMKKGRAASYYSIDLKEIVKDCLGVEERLEEVEKTDVTVNTNVKEFTSFNKCVDVFYNEYKDQPKKEKMGKKEKAKMQQLKYIKSMEEEEEKELKACADMIDENKNDIIKIFKVLNYVKDNKISWEMFYKQKEEETDPLYRERIVKVDFLKNEVVVRLDGGDKGAKDVLLCYKQSVNKNINRLYAQIKKKRQKKEKIENNLEQILANIKEKNIVKKVYEKRELFWFEKFNFTVTKNNFLLLGGRDASQNELLVKRKFTFFFHADVKGGSVVICDGSKLRIRETSF